MNNLILTLLASFGMCQVIAHAEILHVPRHFLAWLSPIFDKLLRCALCTGFWTGILSYWLFTDAFSFWTSVGYGFASSAVCLVGEFVIMALDTVIDHLEKQ